MSFSARYKDSGKDAYPDILEKAPAFFEREPGYSDILAYLKAHPQELQTEGSTNRALPPEIRSRKSWADRGLFRETLETYKLLPITVDSHIGEYISWAHEVADHKGIKDFFELYRIMLGFKKTRIELKAHERISFILDGLSPTPGMRRVR